MSASHLPKGSSLGTSVSVLSLALTQTWIGAASAEARANLLKIMLRHSGPHAILAYAAVKPIHCVRGPEQHIYALDRHHLCVALLMLAAESSLDIDQKSSFSSVFNTIREHSDPLPFPAVPATVPPFSPSILTSLAQAHWPVVVVDDLSHLTLPQFIRTLRQRSYIAFSDVGRWVVANINDTTVEDLPEEHLLPRPHAVIPDSAQPSHAATTTSDTRTRISATVTSSLPGSPQISPAPKRHRPSHRTTQAEAASASSQSYDSTAPPTALDADNTAIAALNTDEDATRTNNLAAPSLTASTSDIDARTATEAALYPAMNAATAAALDSVVLGPSGVVLEGFSLPRVALPPSLLHLLAVEHIEVTTTVSTDASTTAPGTQITTPSPTADNAITTGTMTWHLTVRPPYDCPFKSLSWAVRHRAPEDSDSDSEDSGPGYVSPGWGHYHSSSDWAWRLLCQWQRFLPPRIDPGRVMVPRGEELTEASANTNTGVNGATVPMDASWRVTEVSAALAGQEMQPAVVAVACGLAKLGENMHMAGYIMPRGKAAKRARSRSRSRSRVDRSLASALQAQTRAPEADDSVEVKVCGGLSSALHVSFYHVPLSALRPTQPTVGIGAVQAKVEKMEKLLARGGYSALLQWLYDSPIPCVLASPDSLPPSQFTDTHSSSHPSTNTPVFYMVDHHHLSAALYYTVREALLPHLMSPSSTDAQSRPTNAEASATGSIALGPLFTEEEPLAQPLFSPAPLASNPVALGKSPRFRRNASDLSNHMPQNHVSISNLPHRVATHARLDSSNDIVSNDIVSNDISGHSTNPAETHALPRLSPAASRVFEHGMGDNAGESPVPPLLRAYLLTEMQEIPFISSEFAQETTDREKDGKNPDVDAVTSPTAVTSTSAMTSSIASLSLASDAVSPDALLSRAQGVLGPLYLHGISSMDAEDSEKGSVDFQENDSEGNMVQHEIPEVLSPSSPFLKLSPQALLALARCRVVFTHNLADLAHEPFWHALEKDGLCYLKLFGKIIRPENIPTHISGCINDDYRTLAWMVRRGDAAEEQLTLRTWANEQLPRIAAACSRIRDLSEQTLGNTTSSENVSPLLPKSQPSSSQSTQPHLPSKPSLTPFSSLTLSSSSLASSSPTSTSSTSANTGTCALASSLPFSVLDVVCARQTGLISHRDAHDALRYLSRVAKLHCAQVCGQDAHVGVSSLGAERGINESVMATNDGLSYNQDQGSEADLEALTPLPDVLLDSLRKVKDRSKSDDHVGDAQDQHGSHHKLYEKLSHVPSLTPGYLKVPTGFLEFMWADYLRNFHLSGKSGLSRNDVEAFQALVSRSHGRASLAVQLSACLCRLPRAWSVPGHVKLATDAQCMRNSLVFIARACREEECLLWLGIDTDRHDDTKTHVCSRGHASERECYAGECSSEETRAYLWTLCGRISWLVRQLNK